MSGCDVGVSDVSSDGASEGGSEGGSQFDVDMSGTMAEGAARVNAERSKLTSKADAYDETNGYAARFFFW